MDIKKYKIESDFDKLSLEIDLNVTLDSNANVDDSKGRLGPKIQSNVVIKNGLIESITNDIINIIKRDIYNNANFPYTFKNWVYIVDKTCPEGISYHNHTRMDGLNTLGEWTFVYYVSMPDILNDDDGYIYFKQGNVIESFLPRPGDLLIFPADLLHLPKVNPSSNKNRRIIGGIISPISYKSKKTLM